LDAFITDARVCVIYNQRDARGRESNFLFSYNITSLNSAIKRALNRSARILEELPMQTEFGLFSLRAV